MLSRLKKKSAKEQRNNQANQTRVSEWKAQRSAPQIQL